MTCLYIKKLWKANDMPQVLKNQQIGLCFFGQGFRNIMVGRLHNKNEPLAMNFKDAWEILREVDFTDARHDIIRGILRYLESDNNFANGVWLNSIPTNNEFPRAFWWNWNKDEPHYNPTVNLCGFIIKYADKNSDLYNKGISVAKEAVDHFLKSTEPNEIGDG